jgi:peptidyl-prolyl cis-trans isomerase SurA
LIRVKPTEEEKRKALKIAKNIKKKIDEGLTFEELAVRFSDDRETASNGGDLGFLRRMDFPESIRDKVFALEPGDISEPMMADRGVHIFKCVEKLKNAIHVKHILISYKPSSEDSLVAKKRVNAILEKLRAGSSFAILAEKYSDDPESRDFGGDLGWVPLNQLPEVLQDSVKVMKIGEIKGPVLSEWGFHILKLDDRKEGGKPTFEDLKDDITQYLFQQKLQEELEKLVNKLKSKFYVERRI